MKRGGSNKGGSGKKGIRSRFDQDILYEYIKFSNNKKIKFSRLYLHIYIFTYMYITIIANKKTPIWKRVGGCEGLEEGYTGGSRGRNGKGENDVIIF